MNDLTRSAAIHLCKKGRVSEARQVLLECVRDDPQDVASWMWLVETISDPEERIAALRLCLKANPDNPEVKQALALLAAQKNLDQSDIEAAPPSSGELAGYEPDVSNTGLDSLLPGGWIKEVPEEAEREPGTPIEDTGIEPDLFSSESKIPLQESPQEKGTAPHAEEQPRVVLQAKSAGTAPAARQKKQPAREPLPEQKKKQSIFVFLLKVIAILFMLAVLFSLMFVVWWVGNGRTTRDLVATLAPGTFYQVEVVPTAAPTQVSSRKPVFPPTYTPEPTLAPSSTPAPTADPALAMVITDGVQPGGQSPAAAVSSGNLLAYQAGSNDLMVTSLDTLETLSVTAVPARLLGLAFSQDGKRLAAVDEKGVLTIWDTEEWQEAGTAQLMTGTSAILLEQMAFTPDGYGLLAGYCAAPEGVCSGAPSLVMLNMPDGVQRYALQGVNRFASGSGDLMAVWQAGKAQNLLKLISQYSGDTIRYLELPSASQQEGLSMAAISGDTSQVAAATVLGSITVWDGLTGKMLAAWQSGIRDPRQVIFVPGTTQVLAGNSQSVGQVWDYGSRQLVSDFNLNADHGTFFLDSAGKLLCVRAVSPVVEVWDVIGLQALESFSWMNENVNSAFGVLRTQQIVLFSESGAVSIWKSDYTR